MLLKITWLIRPHYLRNHTTRLLLTSCFKHTSLQLIKTWQLQWAGFLVTNYCFFLVKLSAGAYATNHLQTMINSRGYADILHRMATLILFNLWIFQKKLNYCIQLKKKVPNFNKFGFEQIWLWTAYATGFFLYTKYSLNL